MYKIRMIVLAVLFTAAFNKSGAQKNFDELEHGGFKKENLFTGGSISLGFSGYTFQIGANPVFGYSVAPWLDAGVVANINYASTRELFIVSQNDRLRETIYGGGAFTRIFPVRFLFAHAQFEHNFINQKLIPGNGTPSEKSRIEANSLLVGAGYTTDRYPGSGRPFFYLSLLFDVLNSENSPYTRRDGSILPIIRAGIQVPLFQGARGRY